MNDDNQIDNIFTASNEETALFEARLQPSPNKIAIYIAFFFYSALLVQNLRDIIGSATYEFEPWQLLLLFLALLPYVFLLTRPGLFREVSAHPIRVFPKHLSLCKRSFDKKLRVVPFNHIHGVDIRGSGKSQFLVIETKHFTTQLPVAVFQDPQDLERLAESIVAQGAIKAPEMIEAFNQRKKLTEQYLKNVPVATILLSTAILAGFLLQQIYTGGALYRLPGVGANSSVFLAQGEWFRFLSSSFLHSGIIHLLLNIAGLAALGYIIEGMLGSGRFFAIYTTSLFVGSLFSAVNGSLLSVGASAALFGLLGAYACLHLLSRDQIPIGFVMRLRWWIGITALNLCLPLLIPRIDMAAHIGGFATGFFVTIIFTLRNNIPQLRLRTLRTPTSVSNFAAVLCVLAFGIALREVTTQYLDKKQRAAINFKVMRAMISTPGITPGELNSFAWKIAIDRKAYGSMIELAHDAALHAVQREPAPHIADTLATVLYRMGNFDTALDIESRLAIEAHSRGDKAIYGSQIVRFLQARSQHTEHSDSALQKKYQDLSGAEYLKRFKDETTTDTVVLLGQNAKTNKQSVIIYSRKGLDLDPGQTQQLESFSALSFVGTLGKLLPSTTILIFPFAEEVETYATFNKEQFTPKLNLAPYKKRLIAGEQVLL
jgi:rhomboid protease GluP